ncbi:hypothetical protein OK016_04120 [Vibrio chagasii]|nr:hypothetical protein [Vibrio chagasii]
MVLTHCLIWLYSVVLPILHLGETLKKQADAKPATEEDIARSLERYNRWGKGN